jgi:hypothetical protein
LMTGGLVSGELLADMRTPHALGGPVEGRPWRTAGYGLGLMVDVASPRGSCIGHTGGGPGSVAAPITFRSRPAPDHRGLRAGRHLAVERAALAPDGRSWHNFTLGTYGLDTPAARWISSGRWPAHRDHNRGRR